MRKLSVLVINVLLVSNVGRSIKFLPMLSILRVHHELAEVVHNLILFPLGLLPFLVKVVYKFGVSGKGLILYETKHGDLNLVL